MSDHSHDISSHLRVYKAVFAGLIIGTIITVLASYWDMGDVRLNVGFALLIASAKVFLVAGYFMHLLSEKTTIYGILISTAFFFAGLMALILYSYRDVPAETQFFM